MDSSRFAGRDRSGAATSAEWGAAEALEQLFAGSPVGLAIFDTQLRLVRVNAALTRIHGLAAEQSLGRRLSELFPGPLAGPMEERLRTVLETGAPAITTEHRGRTRADPGHDHMWSISSFRLADPGGRVLGVASVILDITDRTRARERLALLNEAGTCIGTTLGVIRTAEELTEVAVPPLADFIAVDLLESVILGEDSLPGPVDSTAVLRRVAIRSVLPHAPEATHPVGALMRFPPTTPYARCLATGRAVLIPVLDRAAEWLAQDPARGTKIIESGVHSLMTVPLRARDVTLGLAHFYRWQRPDPFEDDDLALAEELGARAALCVDNARCYTREHRAALTMQHSLLLGAACEPTTMETAHRYLPAGGHAGVGGDWFDVIPLSGARTGLVVGDVAGRGIHAAAQAGRLRTTAHTLAELDLAPDELLARLDDIASRAASAQEAVGEPATEIGATCLYAVYDPVSGHCAMASAGHLPPAVARPGGACDFLELPVGPPLGLGGLPFETKHVELPDGGFLVLFTDGLVGGRHRDLTTGLTLLRQALDRPGTDAENLCAEVVRALVPVGPPSDDAVLLLARARRLGAEHVVCWDLPPDPAVVSRARGLTTAQLSDWGIEETALTAELIVSELVTNAIRYGRAPIQLRLIRVADAKLICEVSDAASTSPHMRNATSTDEGGRGLFMIAQFADSWGTRYASEGKTIWAEQSIQPQPPVP